MHNFLKTNKKLFIFLFLKVTNNKVFMFVYTALKVINVLNNEVTFEPPSWWPNITGFNQSHLVELLLLYYNLVNLFRVAIGFLKIFSRFSEFLSRFWKYIFFGPFLVHIVISRVIVNDIKIIINSTF